MKEGNDAINPYEVARKYDHNGLYNLLKSNSVTGTTGHRIDQMAVTLTTRFSTDDFYSGISLAFREPLLNAGIIAGCETKLWYSKIMIEYDENIIYQYKEKRSLVYAGLFKDFTFLRNDRGSSFSVYASLFAGLSFGNKLKGTYFSPGEKIHIIPEAGAKWTRDNLSLFAGADFLKSNYYSYSPLWIRFGCSYNLFFDRIKAPGKTIKWY